MGESRERAVTGLLTEKVTWDSESHLGASAHLIATDRCRSIPYWTWISCPTSGHVLGKCAKVLEEKTRSAPDQIGACPSSPYSHR